MVALAAGVLGVLLLESFDELALESIEAGIGAGSGSGRAGLFGLTAGQREGQQREVAEFHRRK
jgi:hypothetical protein